EEGGANIQALPSTAGAPKAPCAAGIQDAVPHLVQSANEREIRVKVQMKPVKNDTSRASKSTHASGREVTISSTAITKDIDVLIPSQNGKKLCIRFLSVRGCKVTEDSPCYSGRAHFKRESLHTKVKILIRRRFGGLMPEYLSL
ncbi:hypothetical protein L917_14156, partial [Phytophthora nicotianae]